MKEKTGTHGNGPVHPGEKVMCRKGLEHGRPPSEDIVFRDRGGFPRRVVVIHCREVLLQWVWMCQWRGMERRKRRSASEPAS